MKDDNVTMPLETAKRIEGALIALAYGGRTQIQREAGRQALEAMCKYLPDEEVDE